MKKRVSSIILAIVLVLSFSLMTAIPVAADGEDEIFIRARGEFTVDGSVGKATLLVDSASDSLTIEVHFKGWIFWPGAEAQWIGGLYYEAPLYDWMIDGTTVTLVHGEFDVYLLPSGDWAGTVHPDIPVGTISRNKVTFPMESPYWTDLSGTIKIK